ncbi:glycosyltransferase family 2 protein [bacterium]|nr:glycosyltransferase family 2 protein [bacterium]
MNKGKTYLCSVNPNIAIIIPVYHHSGRLPYVIDGVMKYIPRERILVVDDGSPEASGLTASAFGTQRILHSRNLGKGIALRNGFAFWAKRGVEWVITLDGDGQHDPSDIRKFIAVAKMGKYDLAIGSRRSDVKRMPKDRLLSNVLSTSFLSMVSGYSLDDSQCGYRLVNLSAVLDYRWRETGFAFESEMILRFLRDNRRILFVPIRTLYAKGQKSSIKRAPDTFRFFRAIWRTLVKP